MKCKNCGKYESEASIITIDGEFCSRKCVEEFEQKEVKTSLQKIKK